MYFVKKAKKFISDQQELANNRYREVMVETVKFLLDRAVGIDNAVATNEIISHLRNKGFDISREEWQIHVLGPLREHGIFIGSKRGIGMFIISSKEDAKAAHDSILDRILVECQRLKILRELIREAGWDI